MTAPKTIDDLCAVTGLCDKSVKRAIQNGQLPGSKIGRRYVIPAEAFAAYCEGRWAPPAMPEPTPIRPLSAPDMLKQKVS